MSTRRTLRVDPVPPVARWETPLPANRIPPALWVPDDGDGGARSRWARKQQSLPLRTS